MNNFWNLKGVELAFMTKASIEHQPINGSMELLPLCNMNCDMCYVRLSKKEMDSQGRMRTGEEWLKLGKEMLQSGTLFLLLTGGEPLLHPDFKDIYLGLQQMGMILTLNTNATMIDEAWAEFFGKNKPRRINITLYGASNETYEKLCHYPNAFDKVINAVKLLRSQKVDVRLGCSVTPANKDDLYKMYEIAKGLDVPIETDSYMLPATRERENSFQEQNRLLPEEAAKIRIDMLRVEKGEETFEEYRKRMLNQVERFIPSEEIECEGTCLAGKCSFTINWQGKMRPCVISTEPEQNVFEVGFEEAWKRVGESFCSIRYCSKCSACELKPLCKVCAVATKIETGSYDRMPEYLCRYAKETYRILKEISEL